MFGIDFVCEQISSRLGYNWSSASFWCSIFITTGTFTKAAIEEASNAGKQQIDLISGEEFMNKLAEYDIGLKEVKDYEIDEVFFQKI